MKTIITLLAIFIIGNAKAQSIFHEDFENPDSVVSSGVNGFATCTRIAAGGNACDSSSYGAGDSATLTTIAFSTIGNSNVVLSFDHISKVSFFDASIVEVSNDSGITWTRLTSACYLGGSGIFGAFDNKFAEVSYPLWQGSNGLAIPNNTWWKNEIFDIGSLVGNVSNAMIKFKLKDLNGNGMEGRTGWYIDNISVGDSLFNVINEGAYLANSNNLPKVGFFTTKICRVGGYSSNDSVPVYINFGDGTDTNYFAHPDATTYFTNTTISHFYTQYGSYPVFQTISDLLGNPYDYYDTLKIDSTTIKNVTGKVYWDKNSNCIYDSGDEPVVNAELYSSSNNLYSLTDMNGDYSFNASTPFSYQMVWYQQNISSIICPSTNLVTINTLPSYNNDFAVNCNSGFDGNAWGYMWGMRLPSPVIIFCFAGNIYCQVDSGFLKVVIDSKLNFTAAYPANYSISGDTVIWSNVTYPSITKYIINTSKKPTVVLGDTITTTYIAETLPGDLNPSNNIFSISNIVNNSYDPNFKEVNPPHEIDANTTLDYTIHFQNTGNDTAYKVIITDTLDANLDLNTFTINGGSHNFSTNIYPNNLLVFTFNNIMLPDSGANQSASNGFVSYSIKPKQGTAVGTHIKNNSYIFFDSNQPVITNTTDNFIPIPNAINQLENNDEVAVFPNPITDVVTVKYNKSLAVNQIGIYNTMGQMVLLQKVVGQTETTLQLKNLPAGIYMIRLACGNNSIAKKILKM